MLHHQQFVKIKRLLEVVNNDVGLLRVNLEEEAAHMINEIHLMDNQVQLMTGQVHLMDNQIQVTNNHEERITMLSFLVVLVVAAMMAWLVMAMWTLEKLRILFSFKSIKVPDLLTQALKY